MRPIHRLAAAGLLAAGIHAPASAAIVTVFDDFDGGAANFDATVTGAGGTVFTDVWSTAFSGASVDRGAYTITRNNGATVTTRTYTLLGSTPSRAMSGQGININPSGGAGIAAIGSGVSLAFDAPVNSIGFEVGDWGTCCRPSALYFSFDGGAPIQVGVSRTAGDVYLTNGGAGVFVAALDDSGSFSRVQFWGDGSGELLVFGGTIRYANVDRGSLPVGDVPLPGTMALLGLGLAGAGLSARRRKA